MPLDPVNGAASLVAALDTVVADRPQAPLYHFYDSQGRETAALDRIGWQRRAAGIAAGLAHAAGVRAGDRVILAYPAGLEMMAAFYGALRIGAVPVPVPPIVQKATRHRIDQVARDCGAVCVLTAGDGEYPGLPTFDSLGWPDTDASEPVAAGPDDIAFLQYTSGSTSAPRGVRVLNRNLLHNYRLVVDHQQPVAVSWLPQHHDMGLIGYGLYPALAGGVLHGLAPAAFIARPRLWLDLMTRHRATSGSAPDFAFAHILDRLSPDDLAGIDLTSVRFLMAAAEPIRPETYSRFLRAMVPRGLDPSVFYVAYGLAEATLAVTSYGRTPLTLAAKDLARDLAREAINPAAVAAGVRVMSCGAPLGDTSLVIVPRDRGEAPPQPLADGGVGEVWIAGDSVCDGYWGRDGGGVFGNRVAGSNREWLATGDIGFLHNGELVICGRAKDMIILRGQNFYPHDLELSVARALGLRRENVAAVERSSGGLLIVAEAGGRAIIDPVTAVRAVRTDIGIEVDELLVVPPRTLPRTSSGKLMRHQVAAIPADASVAVLAHFRREAEAVDDARPFGWFLARYRLTGDEAESLADIGVDSLDLVGLLHEVQDLLAGHGAGAMADSVDARLIQRLSIAELMAMAQAVSEDPAAAIAALGHGLAGAHAEARAAEARVMAADAVTPSPRLAWAADRAPALGDGPVLVSGATGFLGPFLLASLVEQTDVPLRALVRCAEPQEGRNRLLAAARDAGIAEAVVGAIAARTEIIPSDLEAAGLGLSTAMHDRLANEIVTIFHNGALVNYLFDYARMRSANVLGTQAMLALAAKGRPKAFNHVSTTFIFGWATLPELHEDFANDGMDLLDFGYSQTKWSSERNVAAAGHAGMPVRIFRPALITPSVSGGGNAFDITIRLLKFMIDHGIGVAAQNQVSFTPVDLVANNIVAIAGMADTAGGTFHVVRDDYATMGDITDRIAAQTGRRFRPFPLKAFVPEVIRRATRDDLLFPLLDFLINSIDNIASMEFKRYDSTAYQAARDRSRWGRPDPSLDDTVAGILAFMTRQRLMGH
jgi:thioester reductase-like protein